MKESYEIFLVCAMLFSGLQRLVFDIQLKFYLSMTVMHAFQLLGSLKKFSIISRKHTIWVHRITKSYSTAVALLWHCDFQASDKSFLEKCHRIHSSDPFYTKPRMSGMEFCIKHYANDVCYDVSLCTLCYFSLTYHFSNVCLLET